jgi:hypothetical protein
MKTTYPERLGGAMQQKPDTTSLSSIPHLDRFSGRPDPQLTVQAHRMEDQDFQGYSLL